MEAEIGGYIHREEQTDRQTNANSKTLFYKDCGLGSVKTWLLREGERERDKLELENFILQGL